MFTDNDSQSGKLGAGIKDFMASNSLIAKFAFILLVLLVFIIILRVAPSRCCTTWRFWSTSMRPVATTAPAIDDITDQVPKPPTSKNRPTIPMMIGRRADHVFSSVIVPSSLLPFFGCSDGLSPFGAARRLWGQRPSDCPDPPLVTDHTPVWPQACGP